MTDPTNTAWFLALKEACSNGAFTNSLEVEALRLAISD